MCQHLAVRTEVVKDLHPNEILSGSQLEKLSASFNAPPNVYTPAGGW